MILPDLNVPGLNFHCSRCPSADTSSPTYERACEFDPLAPTVHGNAAFNSIVDGRLCVAVAGDGIAHTGNPLALAIPERSDSHRPLDGIARGGCEGCDLDPHSHARASGTWRTGEFEPGA